MSKNNFYITTSWDDGGVDDNTLITLLQKYNIPATFYRNEPNTSKLFEQGGHTKDHITLTTVGNAKVQEQLKNNKDLNSFAYPKGKYSQTIKQFVGKAGYRYARTTQLFETHTGDILLSPTTIHAYDHNLLIYLLHGWNKLMFWKLLILGADFSDWEDLAKKSFEITIRSGGIYHLWGHSWEIQKRGDWDKLEEVLKLINSKCDNDLRILNGEISDLNKNQKYKYYAQNKFSNNDKYTDKLFKYIADIYDKKQTKVLDLGCGDGKLAKYFTNANYTGIDYGLDKNRSSKGASFLDFNLENIEKLNLPKQDLIIAWGLLEDETNLSGFVKKVNKFAKPDTLVVFTVHNSDNLVFRLKEFAKRQLGIRPFAYSSYTKYYLKKYISKHVVDFGEYLVVLLGDVTKVRDSLRTF